MKPFRTDGCSMWPDGNYRQCCVEHDREYHQGGPASRRAGADNVLFDCVREQVFKGIRDGSADGVHWALATAFAWIMWAGVRVGGHPIFPFPWRWGYGMPWRGAYPKWNGSEWK